MLGRTYALPAHWAAELELLHCQVGVLSEPLRPLLGVTLLGIFISDWLIINIKNKFIMIFIIIIFLYIYFFYGGDFLTAKLFLSECFSWFSQAKKALSAVCIDL